ncbi:hypothetical protein HDF16_005276 [Granulicella aggregans]|uniref:Uncharacterized protein n=1 Tax=Granulicella aggregans TaxID=474949 RepID=A0A7W7ZIG3_9BACT|nr:hypothetical protein [Granulicella aggregans]
MKCRTSSLPLIFSPDSKLFTAETSTLPLCLQHSSLSICWTYPNSDPVSAPVSLAGGAIS